MEGFITAKRFHNSMAVLFAVAIIGIFFLLLANLRAGIGGSTFLTAGIFPTSDAGEWIEGAQTWNASGQIDEWSGRRPLAALYWAGAIRTAAYDVYSTITYQTLLVALTSGMAGVAVASRYGWMTGIISILPTILFAHQYVLGSGTTEYPALILGNIASVALIYAAQSKSSTGLILTAACLSVGMAVRPGPLTVLPVFVLICWQWHASSFRRWALLLVTCVAVSVPFFVNSALTSHFLGNRQQSFSNISHTLYGLARGGKGWNVAIEEIPEIGSLSEGEASQRRYTLVKELIRRDPLMFIEGVSNYTKAMLLDGEIFSYMGYSGGYRAIVVLLLIGLITCSRSKDPLEWAVLQLGVAIIVCSPLLRDAAARAFASVVPLMNLLVSIGFYSLVRLILPEKSGLLSVDSFPAWPLGKVNCILGLAAFSPLAVSLLPAASIDLSNPPISCESSDSQPHYSFLSHRTTIFVDDGRTRPALPDIRVFEESAWKSESDSIAKNSPEAERIYESFAGHLITFGYDEMAGSSIWLVLNQKEIFPESGFYWFCASRTALFSRARYLTGTFVSSTAS